MSTVEEGRISRRIIESYSTDVKRSANIIEFNMWDLLATNPPAFAIASCSADVVALL